MTSTSRRGGPEGRTDRQHGLSLLISRLTAREFKPLEALALPDKNA